MMMPPRPSPPRRRRRPLFPAAVVAGFSLVEVTLALGIVAFALVAILGVLPVAFTASRNSIAQTRATGVAETVFAGLRAQPFSKAVVGAGLTYPEADPATPPPAFTVDLTSQSTSNTLLFYVVLNETEPTGTTTDSRRLRFAASPGDMTTLMQQAGGAASGYELTLHFNNQPDGMPTTGMANRVTLGIRAANGAVSTTSTAGAGTIYNFVTVIANRGGK